LRGNSCVHDRLVYIHADAGDSRGRSRTLRAASGHLVLAHAESARVRLPADRPLLSRGVYRRDLDRPRVARTIALAVASRRRRFRIMIPAATIFAYLAIVLFIGISNRSTKDANAEGYFLASRRLGPAVFLLSLVGTNMTAFSILGASGH